MSVDSTVGLTSTTPTNEPIEKSGFVIYGTNKNGQRAVVATYSQGRYDDEVHKFYGLPKGSVELHKGETPFDGALRETKEESGINLELLLGPEAIEKLRRGKDVTEIDCRPLPPYHNSGIKVKHAYAKPLDRIYVSNGDKPLRAQLFAIEVEGIDQFTKLNKGGLKNRNNIDEDGEWWKVGHRVEAIIKHNEDYPKLFPDLIEWIREGRMPEDRDWNRNRPNPSPIFEKEPKKPSLFERMEKKVMGKPIKSEEEWRDFWKECKRLKKKGTPEQKADVEQLKQYVSTIKQQLLDIGVLNDSGTIKLDEKKRPFHYYQEGADVVPISDLLPYCMQQMKNNESYLSSFGGGSEILEDMPRHQQFAFSQLGQLVQFAERSDLMDMVMKEGASQRKLLAAKRGDAEPLESLRKSELDLISNHLSLYERDTKESLPVSTVSSVAIEPLTEQEIAARANAVATRRA